jgi:drug/metabolite transporter (DMT)-like permease
VAGAINGLGSVFYYMALSRLSASLGQVLYSLYPFFVAIWLLLDEQPLHGLTMFRIALASIAVLFLTYFPVHAIDPVGVLMMLGAAALYGLHLPINQRVLYEAPAPTETLYTPWPWRGGHPLFLIFDRHIRRCSWTAAGAGAESDDGLQIDVVRRSSDRRDGTALPGLAG